MLEVPADDCGNCEIGGEGNVVGVYHLEGLEKA